MSGFRTYRLILTETAGSYVNGIWVPGVRGSQSVMASVQPIVVGQDMESLPEGRRFTDHFKIYSDTQLKVTDDGSDIQPDLLVFGSDAYELVTRLAYQSNVISHYKYIAVKSFKYTTLSDWLTGVTVRP